MSRWIDTAIFMTDELAHHARSRGCARGRHLTIFDGIDYAACVPGGGDAVRREFGIPADAPVVGIVGHIQGWKGQLLVAEAVARARRRCPSCAVSWSVASTGSARSTPSALRARIAEPDLAGHVILTGSRRDVPACLDAMDVVLHALGPRALRPGADRGDGDRPPLIAPREGGPLVIVADGETGLLVPPRDPDALARRSSTCWTTRRGGRRWARGPRACGGGLRHPRARAGDRGRVRRDPGAPPSRRLSVAHRPAAASSRPRPPRPPEAGRLSPPRGAC